MRRFVTAGFLALFVALFAGCDDQATDTPTEPQFKPGNSKVSYDCESPYDLQYQLDALNEAAETIFMSRPTLKGVASNIDNTARKVCTDDPNLAAALEQYYELELLVNGQDLSKLNGGEVARQAFLDMAYSFATGADYNPGFSIPPEALGPDGAVWIVPAGEARELVVDKGDFALRIEEGTFPAGAGDVTIVAYRLPDVFTNGDYSFAPYAPLPEIWWVESSVQVIPLDEGGTGFEIWQCMLDDEFIDIAVIAHALDEGGVELLPRLTGPPPAGFTCDNADDYVAIALGPSAPGWLQLAGSIVQPVLRTLFPVKPLHAMYFKGTGLGGRGGSLSPFAPVIPVPAIDFDRSELNVDGFNYYHFTTTNWANFPDDLFVEETPGTECPSRTVVEFYDASDDSMIQSYDCLGSASDLESLSFEWAAGHIPPRDIYVELWDQLLDVRFRSNTVAIPLEFNTLTIAGTGSGTVTRPITGGFDIDCHFADGVADAGDDCAHTAEEWVLYGGFSVASDDGFAFTGWSGPCVGTGPCLVAMDADKTLTAEFSPESDGVVLNLTVPTRLTVEAASGEILYSCQGGLLGPNTCEHVFGDGDVVTLDAVDWPGIVSPLWLGVTCSEVDNYQQTCTFPMVGNQTVQLVPDTPM